MTRFIALSRNKLAAVLLFGALLLLAATVILTVTDRGENDLTAARQLEVAGDYAGAARLYWAHLGGHPNSLEALKGLAVDLALLGRFDEALPFQEQACARDESDAQLRVELALNYINHQQRPRDAVPVLRRAVAHDPSPRNRAILGQALIASDNGSDGEAELRSLIAESPSYGHAYVVLVRYLEKEGQVEEAESLRMIAAAHGVPSQALFSPGDS